MLYCINSRCKQENLNTAEACQACGTPLLIHDRYHITGFLGERHCAATELFDVTDIQNPSTALVLKTLISEDPEVRLLFEQEQILIKKLTHPGISKGHDSFSVLLENRREILCLVMEYIPGKNLEQWVIENRLITSIEAISQEQAIKWLKQLLETISYLHKQKIIHGDIKPANIVCKPDGNLVLIDFGNAKQINKKIISNMDIGHSGYVGFIAPEQSSGEAVIQSDFYALGKTFMWLLMGSDFNHSIFVPNQAISTALHKLLQEMTMPGFKDRPANAKKILRRLQKIEQATNQQQKLKASLIFAAGVIVGGIAISLVLFTAIKPEHKQIAQACDPVAGDYISCGEKSFFRTSDLKNILGISDIQKDKIDRMSNKKREGRQQIIAKNWSAAERSFREVWQNTQDPEALIYLNNSRVHRDIQTNGNLRKYTIAVAAGLNGENAKGLNILRGVAYAQTRAINEFNIGLIVVLVDDQDNTAIAQNMAKELIKRQEIIAVVGHHVSDVTIAALEIYDKATDRMVIISPTSTSKKLDRYTDASSKRNFFRTVATDQTTAKLMAANLLKKGINKMAIFHTRNNAYSDSLASELKKEFAEQGGSRDSIIEDPDQFKLFCLACKQPSWTMKESIEYAKGKGAKAFVLIPDASENAAEGLSPSMKDALNIVKNSKGIDIFVGDSMAGVFGLLTKEAVGRVTIISPWEMREDMESGLVKFWQQGTAPQPQINWYAHTAYNATQVLVAAMQQNRHRKIDRGTLRELISAPGFSTLEPDKVKFKDGTGELDNTPATLTVVVECKGKPVFRGLKSKSCPKS